jgi:hypothetical protein
MRVTVASSGGRLGLLVVACRFLPVGLDLRSAPMRRWVQV